jgi:hypothetical protein
MTTVACVFVKGHVPFTSDYVRKLASMVYRWMDRPYRFVCLTDKKESNFGSKVEPIRIPWTGEFRGWWAKVSLFDPALNLTGRVLYLDLDTLVVGPLAPILDFPAPFALIPHAGRFDGRDGLQVVKRFNSSVMVWNAGEQAALYTEWTPAIAAELHGDQDWVGQQAPNAAPMPLEWFPRISEITAGGVFNVPAAAKVVLVKTPKCEEAARRWPSFREVWR